MRQDAATNAAKSRIGNFRASYAHFITIFPIQTPILMPFKRATLKAKAYEPGAPLIPPEMNLPEFTLEACIVGVLISVIMGAANAYFGLFAGMTVSATIPAAVLSMAWFYGARKKNSMLEVNIAKTAGSAGESLAAGVIFTIPAFVIAGVWSGFDPLTTTMIAMVGGMLGVLFTVPLRRVLVIESRLPFPEGIAGASVLRAGSEGGKQAIFLVVSIVVGSLFKFLQSGAKLWHEAVEGVVGLGKYAVGGKQTDGYLYMGSNLSPALLGVGYIVGLRISSMVFAGGLIGWFIIIPLLLFVNGIPTGTAPLDAFWVTWSTQIRYVGVGTMIVGGLWTMFRLRSALATGISGAFKKAVLGTLRTDKDLDMKKTFIAICAMVLPIGIVYYILTESILVSTIGAIIMLVAAFFFSAIAGYLAGLVGSSNNPISGVTISTLLFAAIVIMIAGGSGAAGIAGTLGVAAVVCCAAAISGDVLQDLKTGYIIGATPWKMELSEIVGVIPIALIMAPVLTLLHSAYGIGTGQPGSLQAPQASLMAMVATALFEGTMPWPFVFAGMGLAFVLILLDLPVMPIAVGIYLPLQLSVPMFVGGVVREVAEGKLNKKYGTTEEGKKSTQRQVENGILFSSGLIAGEALMGILVALLIVLNIVGKDTLPLTPEIVGILASVVIVLLILRSVLKPTGNSQR